MAHPCAVRAIQWLSKPFSGFVQRRSEINLPCLHPQVEKTPRMFSRIREVTPQADLLSCKTDFERVAPRTADVSYAPMYTFASTVRKKIRSEFLNTIAQQLFDPSCVAHEPLLSFS